MVTEPLLVDMVGEETLFLIQRCVSSPPKDDDAIQARKSKQFIGMLMQDDIRMRIDIKCCSITRTGKRTFQNP